MSAAGSCAAGWRAASSWCAPARASKNEIHAVLQRRLQAQAAVL